MGNNIHLAIIEDNHDYSNELKAFFEGQDEFASVITIESLELFMDVSIAQPLDIILVDYQLPGLDGISGIPLLKKMFPKADVVILTIYADSEVVFKGLCSGAVGYLLKDEDIMELKKQLLQIRSGGSFMSAAIARKVFNHFGRNIQEMDNALTPREWEVVECLAEGLLYKEIAAKLSISFHTVQEFIKRIYRKLEVNDKVQLIKKIRSNRPFFGDKW